MYICVLKLQTTKALSQKIWMIVGNYQVLLFLCVPIIMCILSMIVDDHEMSIGEPAEYEANALFNLESSDDESEPESESTAYWRAERLAREEFIEVYMVHFYYMYMYICMLEL